MAESNFEISLEQIKMFRKATGCPIGEIRSVIEGMKPELRARILIAIKTQDGSRFYDPIEDDPEFKEIIENAHRAAVNLIEKKGLGNRRGAGHGIWTEQARILNELGIVWYSPREMNPSTCFD